MTKLSLTNTYQRYPEYKDSGVKWVGQIPADWDVATSRRLFRTKKTLASETDSQKLLSLTLQGVKPRIQDGSGKNPANYDTYQEFKKDNLVFCLFDYDVTPRTIGYVSEDGMMTGAYTRLIPKEEADSKFYYYYFLSLDYSKELLHLCTGLRNGISKPVFWSMKNPLPPKPEQEKIARFLDKETERIDTIMAKKQRLIELLKEKRTATINHAVTKGLDPNAELVDSGVDWIGKIPKVWEVKKIKFVSRLNYGESLASELRENGEVPVYGSNGEVGKHSVANTKAPVLFVGRKGSFGAIKFSRQEAFAIDTVYYIDQTCTKQHLRWLFYVLSAANLGDVSQDTGVPGLSRDAAYKKIVPVPTASQQRQIADELDLLVSKYEMAINTVQNSITLLQELKSSLISHAVTGKIKV